ncbi:methyl-accepting chemotaxis protein [Vibrio sp. SCSIO 43136]|uniref:methyl-accepting chemotaxis protein n=1 Tax=Vibrio sp. SCSIO 43136 TaxID=2819101 RepID=UPI002074B6BD|nr:methyl-accepting chemotaxis protein [Vibrio sp. SCSIO 43136]USD67935.1 methyl-accepting chemotaxis protein [Vibrio sp. SCSIO 43136]
MFKKLSLKNKLALSASVAILSLGAISELISFQSSLSRLEVEVEQRLQSTTTAYNHYVSDWLRSKERALASIPASVGDSPIVPHLEQIRDAGAFDNIFLAYPDGSQKNANGVTLPPGNDDPRKWGWYTNAKAKPGQVFLDNPTVAAATGANVVSMGLLTRVGHQDLVLGADVEITDIVQGLDKVILPGEGYMFIANSSGNIYTHSDAKLLNQPLSKLGIAFSDVQKAAATNDELKVTIKGDTYVLFAKPIGNTSLITVAIIDEGSLLAPIYSAMWSQSIATIIALVVVTLLFNLLCSILFRPLASVSDALAQIAHGSGDLTQRIPVVNNDEVGALANNFNTFVESLNTLIGKIRSQATDLKAQAEVGSVRTNRSVSELNNQHQEITMVATAVTEMASATQEIASHAEQTAQAAQNSSTSTSNGLALVVDTKASINNLAGEVNETGRVISDLSQHAKEIETVLATIQDIAEQTNLLALNAAIEAARAGEQGRGFAVVADEVRVLSQRTHSSTEEIKSTIDTLQNTTSQAVELMDTSSKLALHTVEDADRAAQALEEINSSVALITDMATQIATAAEEQTHVTGEITQNVTSNKDVTDQLVAGAQESLSDSDSLKHQADSLSQDVATFKLS